MRIPGDQLSGERTKLSTVGDTAIADRPVTHITAVIADTATASGASAIDLELTRNTIFIFGVAVYDTVTVNFVGTDAIAHGPIAPVAEIVTDTATVSGVSAVNIDFASGTIVILGAAVYYTVTVSFAGIDFIAHEPVTHIAAVVADTATSSGVSADDIDLTSDIFISSAPVYYTVTISFAGTDAIDHEPVAHIAAAVADTATAFVANAVDIGLASDTIYIFGAAVYNTVTVSLAGTGATAHQPVAHSAAGVADTATTFGTTAVYIDLASDTIFVFGAAVYDTVTIIFAGTDTIVHEPVTHIAAVVADTAPAFGATVVDIDLADDDIFIFGAVFDIVSIGFADADAITHGPVARIAAVVADNAIVTRDSCIYDRSHPSVGKHNRMKPTMR